MSEQKGHIDYRMESAALLRLCDDYDADPVAIIDMLMAERRMIDGAVCEKLESLRVWAVAVANREEWALEQCA